ncbi:hypothetical protein FAGAP_10828 [Fusarium agapanthi]|uniref:Uncharacterized protein n=1 Tax=Fusarium agapanthi TaxID=1803897 RepID=A0A9P5B1F9_9HYPO|nr:hypothetical protein FAGAP_10828 [Fusarium agapanthi]
MSSSNGDNVNPVEHVATALQKLSLEDTSQVRAATDAAPVPVNTPDREMSIPFRKEGWPEDWREKDFHTSHNVEEKVVSHILRRDKDLKERGACFASFAVEEDYGKIRVGAQQFPGLDNLAADRTRVRILVERRVDEEWQFKNIDVEDLPAYESDAYKDTAKIFPRAIELSRAGDKMAWVEGQMVGEVDQETKAPISVSQEFIHPGDFNDTRSSTSRGHRIAHSRPTGVGAGWGGYDEFYDWQSNGRAIKKEWVREGDPSWRNKTVAPLKFTGEDGKVEIVPYSDAAAARIQERTSELRTLHEKLEGQGIGGINQRGRGSNGRFRGGSRGRGGRGNGTHS